MNSFTVPELKQRIKRKCKTDVNDIKYKSQQL